MKVLVLLPVVGNPRDSIRISMLTMAGFKVKALAFERDYLGDAGYIPECDVAILGRIQNGHYLQRVWRMCRVLPTVRREIGRSDIVYAFGPDMAGMALVSSTGQPIHLATEISDIRRIQVNRGVLGAIVRGIDRWVIKRSFLMVIAASGFGSWYFNKRLRLKPPTLLIENKLEPQVGLEKEIKHRQVEKKSPQHDKLRIGYFGVLRCKWSLSMLRALAESSPETIEIKIAGLTTGTEDDIKQISSLPNVEVTGPYRSPVDLPDLYSDIDLIWACYPGPEGSSDWREAQLVCRSNRFYESCLHKRPLISLVGSGDAEVVAQYDIGLVLNGQSAKNVIDSVADISCEQLSSWASNMRLIPRHIYEYSDETAQLKSALINRGKE